MNIKARMKNLIGKITENQENRTSVMFSLVLTITFLFLLGTKVNRIELFHITDNPSVLYLLLFVFSVLTVGEILLFEKKFNLGAFLKKIILIYLPIEVLFLFYAAQDNRVYKNFHPYFFLLAALYVVLIVLYFLIRNFRSREDVELFWCNWKNNAREWFKKQGKSVFFLLFIIMTINFSFGMHHLSKFGAVDEPLWLYDRVPDFWKDIGERDWNGTRESDKPGVTVIGISGLGLFDVNPNRFEPSSWKSMKYRPNQDRIEELYFSFRFPLYLFTFLSIPIFYFLLERLLGKKSAIFSVSFIGLAPVVIGMSKIVNPDAVLWVFSSLSIFAFLVYLTKEKRKYLYFASFLLGLALLTKYVANILFVFFFGLIFLEYVLNHNKFREIKVNDYLKQKVADYLILILGSLATFFVLYPATWVKIDRLLIGTIYSEAFETIWVYFVGALAFVIIDTFLFKNFILSPILRLIAKARKALFSLTGIIFMIGVTGAAINTYTGMPFFDFEDILSSPKSGYSIGGFWGLTFANFYPMIFGITPLALAFLLLFAIKSIFKGRLEKTRYRVGIYILLFVTMYYVASTFSHVAAMLRYQILVFPLILTASGIGVREAYKFFKKKTRLNYFWVSIIIILIGFVSLWIAKPLHISYASIILPQKYYTDYKDMGTGSYEAAEYLNSLPEAKKLNVWTDKSGVCAFFVGHCYTGFDFDELELVDFDYAVVSSGRESRTTKRVEGKRESNPDEYIIPFDKYYDQKAKVVYKLFINGRANNYVKVVKTVKY